MVDFSLKVQNQNGKLLAQKSGEDEVSLVYQQEYCEGDQIVLETSVEGIHAWVQLEDTLGKSMVYLTGTVVYTIPFGEKRANLSPRAFSGEKHLISVRLAKDFEIAAYRNLSLNVCDQHKLEHMYPHATANVETRGESVFAAQNAIDGVTANESHGEWPYESWGINMQDDAEIQIDFGRLVEVDRIILYTRADFPHDNWWKQVTFQFSDESSLVMKMEKSKKPHEIVFPARKTSKVTMKQMLKSEEPSPFPALSQIEVYGHEIEL